MKKFLTILLTLLFIASTLALTACGDKKVTITFDGNGGLTQDGKDTVSITVNPSEMYDAPEFFKDGYIFNGWDKSLGDIKEDTTVTAKWTKLIKLTFLGNGGLTQDGKDTVIIENHVPGTNPTAPIFIKDEKKVAYWTFSLDGVTKFTDITADCVITAQYLSFNTIKINYNVDGPISGVDSITVNVGSEVLESQLPKLTGWSDDGDSVPDWGFVGWYINGKQIKVGDVWLFDEEEVTIIALWTPLWSDYV